MPIKKILCLIITAFFLAVPGGFADTAPDLFRSPAEGSVSVSNCPDIRLSLSGSGADGATVKIFVNGKDVTELAVKSFAFVSYTPTDPLPEGKNQVTVTYMEGDQKREVSWSFIVDSPQIIKSITHDGGELTTLGQTLTVTVKAKPGCSGRFDLSHLVTGVPLVEGPPGVYKGAYKVRKGDHLNEGTITVMMQAPDGSRQNQTVAAPPWISASFFRVKISYPKNGQYVGRTFEVKGVTTPDVLVNISSKLGFNFSKEDAMGSGGPAAGGYRLRSGDDGTFSQKIGFPPIVIAGMKMLVYVQATDRQGNRSIPDQVIVHYRSSGADKKAPEKPDENKKPVTDDGKKKDE